VSASAIPLIIAGASGRMGRTLVSLASADPGLRVVGAIEAPGHRDLGQDAGSLATGRAIGVELTDSLDRAAVDGAVLIEFTAPAPSLEHLRACSRLGVSMVLGTTGFSAVEQQEIERLAERVACLQAANMSRGVTILQQLVEDVARRLGPSFDVELVEIHHRLKKDAPSGTALALARAAARGRDLSL